MKIFSGLGMQDLTAKVCEILCTKPGRKNPKEGKEKFLNICPGKIDVKIFPDGEIRPQILENVRGQTVFIIQSTDSSDSLIKLFVTLDALRRSSTKRIIAVIPYFGYARQERKDRPRVPISAALIAKFIEVAGANAVLTVDLHAGAIQGFFHGPCDHLYGSFILIPAVRKMMLESGNDLERYVIVAPDKGRVELNYFYAKKLGIQKILFCGKRKTEDSASAEAKKEVTYVDGVLPKNAICITCDDMIGTAGTIKNASEALVEKGLRECNPISQIIVTATHALLSDPAIERIEKSPIDKVLVTDTIALGEKKSPKIIVHSIAPVLAEAIYRINRNESISSLFENHF